MIGPSLSSAQLDTIDVDGLRALVQLERAIAGMERFGAMMHGVTIAAHSATVRAAMLAAVTLMRHRATEIDLDGPLREPLHQLTMPTPIDCAVFPIESRPRSNPTAPIPERIRRQNRPRW